MAVKTRIKMDTNGAKISAIKAWRTVVGPENAVAFGLTEAKAFVEKMDCCGYFDVILSDAQFGRFVVAMNGDCNGAQRTDLAYGNYKPTFIYDGAVAHEVSKILDFTR
jgi:hypothetical protein